MTNNNSEDQNFKEELKKKINNATKQMKDNKALDILKDEVIDKLDKAITPYYKMAKKAKKTLDKFNYFIEVFAEIGKLVQFKAMLDAQKKGKSSMTI